jgi:hypothetical protein
MWQVKYCLRASGESVFSDLILTIWTALQSIFSGVLLRFRLLRDIFGEEFRRNRRVLQFGELFRWSRTISMTTTSPDLSFSRSCRTRVARRWRSMSKSASKRRTKQHAGQSAVNCWCSRQRRSSWNWVRAIVI